MKKSRVFALIGTILVGVGILLAIGSVMPGTYTEEFTIPAGNYYYGFESKTIWGLSLSGSFTATSDTPVTFYVFTQDQYDEYAQSGYSDSIYHTTGLSGSFDVSHGESKLYMVFEHSLAYTSVEQDISVTYTINGISASYMVAGLILIAVGVVAVFWSTRVKAQEAKAGPVSPPADVMLFDQQKPPETQ